MATKYWVGGSGNWDGVTTTHWATSSGGSGGAALPTSSDDVTFDSNSGTSATVTITAAASVNSITINKSDLTLIDNAGITVTGLVTLTTGTLNTNGQSETWGGLSSSNSNARFINFGASNITITRGGYGAWALSTIANLNFNSGTSIITFIGGSIGFQTSNLRYYSIVFTGGGLIQIGSGEFVNLTVTGTASKTCTFNPLNPITVTGSLNLNGNSATNRLLVNGSYQTITNTGTTMNCCNVDFIYTHLSNTYNASLITGNSGDCGGNTNIIFTPSEKQTWSGTSGGEWSTNAWSTRVPLPQDDVVINSAFSSSQTIAADMPRLGRSIDWTDTTGNPAWALNSTANTIYGSVTLISAMTLKSTQSLTYAGVSSYTITSAGHTYGGVITFNGNGGTWTLQDDFKNSSSISVNNGYLEANNNNVTCTTFACNGGDTCGVTMGSGTWTLASTATTTIWYVGASSNFSGATATIVISAPSVNPRIFTGGGYPYGILTYTVPSSTGQLTISDSNTFNTINFSDTSNGRTLQFAHATTTTITDFNVNGSSGKLVSLQSDLAGTPFTLSKSSGVVSCDYLSVKDSAAKGGAQFYAGSNSTNVSGNTGWMFTAPSKNGEEMMMANIDQTSITGANFLMLGSL